MSRKRWSRYQAPDEPRHEDGSKVEKKKPSPTPPKGRPTPSRSSGANWDTSRGKKDRLRDQKKRGKRPWVIGGIVAAVFGVPAAWGAIGSANDGGDLPEVDRKLLDESFVEDGLTQAAEAEAGRHPFRVRLDEYELRIEYFDAGKQQIRSYEFNDYVDGYEVRVEDNYYDDFTPRPFRLAAVDPGALVSTAEDAIDRAEDPYSFYAIVEVDSESGTTEIVGRASEDGGGDVVEVTTEIEDASVEPQ